MNATGGSLPGPDTLTARNQRLDIDECRPVLPRQNRLYKVAEMRLFYFPDPPAGGKNFYSRIFGGRAGFTPVMTVLYDRTNDTRPDIQFSCLKTFERNGNPRKDPLASGGASSPGVSLSMLMVSLPMAMAVSL